MILDYVPIAVRVYTERMQTKKSPTRRPRRREGGNIKPRFILVLDTETSTDACQRLLFGSYRYLRITWEGNTPHAACVEEGLLYADDLPEHDRRRLDILRDYAEGHNLKFSSQGDFNNTVLYRAAYKLRGTVVGVNLPFDISRLAYQCGAARGRFAGGFSFALFGYRDKSGVWRENRHRPRVDIKTIDSVRHLIGFTRPFKADQEDRIPEGAYGGRPDPAYAFRGHFLDLRQLNFALTDEKGSLASMCERWGVEHGKIEVPTHGRITSEYIGYNRRDVLATVEVCLKLLEEYFTHPIALQPTKAYSPASIGKAYLDAMGIQPILARQPDFPKEVLGYAMTAYFGGRAECRIRRVPMPVVYKDFRSMYPTVCCLMKLWRFLTCERIEVVEDTERVRAVLSSPTLLEDCFAPEMWQNFVGLVRIDPQSDVFPVRAHYDASGSTWQIGVNPLTCREPLWLTFPDAVALTVLTGRPPHILKAIRLVPRGTASTLNPIRLRGAVPIDPRFQDFFKTVIEEREGVKRRGNLSSARRDSLEHFLKIFGNATSYGIFAEMVRHELSPGEQETVRVYGLDGAFKTKVSAPESPGEFAFPLIAACITGAARLRLALLERIVTDAGGTYAFCDTDAMPIVATETGGLIPCPGGPHRLPDGREAVRAMSWAEAERIRQRFNALNPYDCNTVPDLLKLEKENFDLVTGRQRQLWCYAISAKRYALLNLDEHGRPILRKWSEHGLGHLLNPIDPNKNDRIWIRTLWEGIVMKDALGQSFPEPDWLTRPAIGRISVSSPSLLHLFEGMNKGKPYADRVKPFNFLLTAFVTDAFGLPEDADPKRFHLVAPWNPDSRQWLKIAWIDRHSGRKVHITISGHTGREGVARVKTYADGLTEYRVHPEPKSLGPDGQPCNRKTMGLLSRRPVTAGHLTYIGKESNKLDDREAYLIHDPDEVVNEYSDPRHDSWHTLVLPVLQGLSSRDVIMKTGIKDRTFRHLRSGTHAPQTKHRTALTTFAIREAEAALREWCVSTPPDALGCLAAYLHERTRRHPLNCTVCQTPLPRGRMRYCTPVCRQHAYRQRRSSSASASCSSSSLKQRRFSPSPPAGSR